MNQQQTSIDRLLTAAVAVVLFVRQPEPLGRDELRMQSISERLVIP